VRHADLVEAGPGVWAAIARPDRAAVGNAAIVDLDAKTLVVDTHISPGAARELRTAAEELKGRPVSLVLNTHWHGDHVLGNGEFEDARIVATGRTRELMGSLGVQRLEAQRAAIESELPEELQRLRAAGDDEGAQLLEAYAGELATLRHRFPDEAFEDERDFGAARALTFGGGHTESDTFVLVEDAGVLIAGDLIVVGMQPWSGHGDPRSWAAILDRLLALDWDRCIPGHGPVSGREVVEPLRDYQLALAEAVESGEPEPEVPAEFREWDGAEMWQVNIEALR